MSLETWKKEFYFIDASDVPVEQAVEHSLRKWIGLRSENLEKHGVSVRDSVLFDGDDYMVIADLSCALCVHYMYHSEDRCASCPLFIYLNRACDGGIHSEYSVFCSDDNPEPMIRALSEIYEQD